MISEAIQLDCSVFVIFLHMQRKMNVFVPLNIRQNPTKRSVVNVELNRTAFEYNIA